MTKKEMFTAIANVPAVAENEEMVKFLNHQIELLDNRKSSGTRKLTAKQVENESYKEFIREYLDEAGRATCGELVKALKEETGNDEITSQRVSALLTQLGEKGTNEVSKEMVKKVAYFSLKVA